MDKSAKMKSTAKLSCSKEKIERKKKDILRIVESLLDPVSNDYLINACKTLSQTDYGDVIEERNIIDLCGYPLCRNKVKLAQQKYKIDYNTNKVYDITERKCFCSNECYKASNFLKSQLLEIPVWFQEESVKVRLLQDCQNSGSAGEEVIMREKIKKSDLNAKVDNNLKDDCKRLLLDEIAQFADDFKDKLVVKEKETTLPEDKSSIQSDGNPKPSNGCQMTSQESRKQSDSNQSSEEDSASESILSDNSDDEKFFPKSNDELYPSHRLMPGASVKPLRSPILITPLPINKKTSSSSPVTSTVSDSFLGQLYNILSEWITLETYQFLLGEDGLSAGDIEELFAKRNISPTQRAVSLSDMRDKYLKICMKLDKMEEEEEEFEKKVLQEEEDEIVGEPQEEQLENELTAEEKLAMFFSPDSQYIQDKQPKKMKNRKKKKSKKQPQTNFVKSKQISVPPATKKSPQDRTKVSNTHGSKPEEEEEKIAEDPVLPMVDSVSQIDLRRQMLISKLRIVYLDLLPLVGLHYKSISDDVRLLVMSFRLSPKNVFFRPSEWKVISLVLFRMLKQKFEENFCDDSLYETLLEKASVHEHFNIKYVDSLIGSLVQKH